MENIHPFKKSGQWFKGNLHCHSTVSDGNLPPEEVVKIYKDNGWNFLAFTEHETYSDYADRFDTENFITIPGIEPSNNDFEHFNYNHFLGISKGRKPIDPDNDKVFTNGYVLDPGEWSGAECMQRTIDIVNKNNNISVICHPVWSRSNIDILTKLSGYNAVEIYNYGCEIESNSGLSTTYWDYLLRLGMKVWGIATDDAHHYMKDECGGFIVVKADELTIESIADSIVDGSFYSSNGPEIYDYYVEDGHVYVECSNVKHIHVMTYGHLNWGCSFHAQPDKYLNSANYKMSGYEQYVRVECEDENGRRAWSNPIFLEAKKA